jgi:lysylphosphatidylglycerol synthetase-like protein (DUF2156 family)
MPKFKYETSIVTFIQFIAMSVLYFLINLGSIISTCTGRSYDCVSNSISSITLSIVIVIAFGCVWILGYFVQKRRNRGLALLLMAVEAGIFVVELLDAHNFSNALSLITSLIDVLLALFVIILALRLYRAKGGRVVNRHKISNYLSRKD